MRARFEGRAGRRSQRQVACAALVGAGGATCAVRAALLGASERQLHAGPVLWRGSYAERDGSARAPGRTLALDDAGECIGCVVGSGRDVCWSLVAEALPRRAPAAATLATLAAAAARWPLLAAAVLATPPEALWHEPLAAAPATWARGRVALVGGAHRCMAGPFFGLLTRRIAVLRAAAARGAARAALDATAWTADDASGLAELLQSHGDDAAAAVGAYAAAAAAS